jgi:hypothetical protein
MLGRIQGYVWGGEHAVGGLVSVAQLPEVADELIVSRILLFGCFCSICRSVFAFYLLDSALGSISWSVLIDLCVGWLA